MGKAFNTNEVFRGSVVCGMSENPLESKKHVSVFWNSYIQEMGPMHGEHIEYGDSTCNIWCISLTYLLRSW